MNNFSSDENINNLHEKEARGLLIDNTRISAIILAQEPSLYKYVKHTAIFKNNRNKQEALQLSQIIDSMVSEGININTSLALERGVRRLVGVITADNLGRWEACTALQLQDHSTTLLPPLLLDRIIKRSAQISRFTNNYHYDNNNNNDNNYNNNNNNNYRGNRHRGRGRGRGNYQHNNNNTSSPNNNRFNNNNNINNNNNRKVGGEEVKN